ncbi:MULTISPECIES: helix-turn-helix domain-containing protein [Halomonadaceae]|jgi:predicted transcriptional regulator|uniref:Helix-turn-helix transcriptional regulator n=1 Tax=Billgrantia aerodenitrificans TaxID=2733483 RepID=A0ABS9AP35_9GAMM|nr:MULTISPECIES: helix-turn-helix domain-containing protein [Halomonas]MCE8012642.1 helix-turn-helix transcriptional regulator [Halomonas desiderata]MCE8023463.1 helix-turn-helix transcriptional regulator [Halomonas aerodenitrificans]MCE8039940.1 helix-turn-helix transcriptional regulator [Halomonas sp. MCCC 1A11062]
MARTLDQLIANESPEVVNRAKEKADAMLLELRLAEIRHLVEMTQAEMAEALGVKQPTIAGMEKSGQDLRLSSLKRYVEAIGGKVRLDIELPDGTHHGFPV